jgi:hypothetical protein
VPLFRTLTSRAPGQEKRNPPTARPRPDARQQDVMKSNMCDAPPTADPLPRLRIQYVAAPTISQAALQCTAPAKSMHAQIS